MKRILWVCVLLLGLCSYTAAERHDAKYTEPTEQARAMQTYLGAKPCWDEEWLYVNMNRDEVVPVYSAEGICPYRGDDSGWEVSLSEPLHVIAADRWKEWLLVEYELSDHERRIGWIVRPEGCALSEEKLEKKQMRYHRTTAVAVRRTAVTDDPYGSQRSLIDLEADAEIECLGWVDAYYAYVMTVIDEKLAYGFVPLKDLAVPESLRVKEIEQEIVGAWQFAGGDELLGYGIVLTDEGRYMGCSTDQNAFPAEGLTLDIRACGRYEVVRNDPSMKELHNEHAPYALILREDEGGVSRYAMEEYKADGAEHAQNVLMLYDGESGGGYERMTGEEAQLLLDAVAQTKVFRLEDHTQGCAHGKVGVTDGILIRADIELEWEGMPKEIWLCECEYSFDDDEWQIKSVIGVAHPDSESGGGYCFEGKLPQELVTVRFYAIYEDGVMEEFLALDVKSCETGC